MGMSSGVSAYRDMDVKFNQMLEMKKICDLKKFSYPKEVSEYFGHLAGESDEVIYQEMNRIAIPQVAIKRISEDSTEGYEIDVTKLPKELKILRFTNSW